MNNTKHYLVSAASVENIKKALVKANRKATKLGLPPLSIEFGQEKQIEDLGTDGRPTGRFVRRVPVVLAGTTPVLNGWRLVATVSPLRAENGTLVPIITGAFGQTGHSHEVSDPLYCDHCKVRRERLETFLVVHEDGSWKQVARNCLKDFVGGNGCDPDSIVRMVGVYQELENTLEEGSNSTRNFYSESLLSVMAHTIVSIRNHGWVSKKMAMEQGLIATATRVRDAMDLSAIQNQKERELAAGYNLVNLTDLPAEADFTKANEYMENLSVLLDKAEDEGRLSASDYLFALRVLVQARTVNAKAFGIAVSAVSFVDRELTPKDNFWSRVMEARKTSRHMGAEGQRLDVGVTVVEATNTSTGLCLMTLLSDDGNILKWFTGKRPEGVEDRQHFRMQATVRRHDNYKGVNQTVINRPTFKQA